MGFLWREKTQTKRKSVCECGRERERESDWLSLLVVSLRIPTRKNKPIEK